MSQVTKRTPKGERARGQILDAAEQLFARSGFHGTSVRDVATQLEIPTASLLHHFPRKERLYGAVLERIAGQLEVALTSAVRGGTDYGSKLRRLTRKFAQWSLRRPDHCTLLLRELLDNAPRIAEARRLHLQPVVEKFASFIREGQRAGVFRPIDPVMFVIHLAGSTSYFVVVQPTLARVVQRSPAAIEKDYRKDLAAMIERVVLVDPPAA
jgi:TetR/AcrR family transcriptional regulator